MRSISANLLTEQNAASNTPYVYLVFTSADGCATENYGSDQKDRRILLIDHQEEPYNEYASVILRNDDRSIPNLKGYWTEIGYGYVVSGTGEYSQTSRLWVKHQQEISAQGKRVMLLELEGMWAKLGELPMRIGNPPYYRDESGTLTAVTPYSVMETIIESELGWTLAALVEDDSIINTYEIPTLLINQQPFESAGGLLYRLINITKSYLRSKAGLEMEVKYSQSTDSVAITYYSGQAPYFYEYIERNNVLIPNDVIVFANPGADGLWTDIKAGEATDQAEIDAYDTIRRLVPAAELTTKAQADTRAAALLARAEAEVLAGRMYAPHDCQLELYDRIEVRDSRGL